jgi:putative transposase
VIANLGYRTPNEVDREFLVLTKAASLGLPTLADKGYTRAGIGIKVPAKSPDPDPGTRWRNELVISMRASAERANALITHFKALRCITLSPASITSIAAAAPVIFTLHKGFW